MSLRPVVPENITVHLGAPDRDVGNVTVPFADYIKNVACSEIYPTWPENAIRANVYAQVSYTLNRIYTEYYRSRGYDFDITNSIAYDQSFVYGRDIFENVSQIVDNLFNDYIVKGNRIEPLFATYCDGKEVSCNGLSQWGTVTLAKQGKTPYEILQYYYGNDVSIVKDAPVESVYQSYNGRELSLGSIGNEVKTVQVRLNRISKNYPVIPKTPTNGVFSTETDQAVRVFQRLFSMKEDGIVGKATWYQIQRIYVAVKRLNDVASEGVSLSEISDLFQVQLQYGDVSSEVGELQYLLSILSSYEQQIPPIDIDNVFGTQTEGCLKAFQALYCLPETGKTSEADWETLYDAVLGIFDSLPSDYFDSTTLPYPGRILRIGSEGEDVAYIQRTLNYISGTYQSIPKLEVDGLYGPITESAVLEYQRIFGLNQLGIVASQTWDSIVSTYRDLYDGAQAVSRYPGVVLKEGESL